MGNGTSFLEDNSRKKRFGKPGHGGNLGFLCFFVGDHFDNLDEGSYRIG